MLTPIRKLNPKNLGAAALTILLAAGASSPALAWDHGDHRYHDRGHHYGHHHESRDRHLHRYVVDRYAVTGSHYRWHHHYNRVDGDYALGLVTGYLLGLSDYD